MKILFLSDDFPPDNVGGAGIVVYNLAKEFKKLGHEVHVISTVQQKEQERNYQENGLGVYKIYSQYHRRWRAYVSLYNPQTIGKVRRIIKRIKPNVVHAHNIHTHLSYGCLRVAKLSGASVCLTAHDVMLFNYGKIKFQKNVTCENYFDFCRPSVIDQIKEYKKRYNPFRNFVIRRYLRYVDKVIAVSNALKRALVLNGITQVEVVHNGIDLSKCGVEPEEVSVFRKINNLENKKVVLFGGRISEEKGLKQAIQVLDLLMKEFSNLVLLVAGSKGVRGIDTRDLPIKFLGWLEREKMNVVYSSCDLVLVPSICFDSFPTVNLEAMAFRKPVISSCFGGSSEVVVNNETGYLINPYDTTTVVEKMGGLLRDDQKALKFGQNGHERVRDFFSLKHQAEKYLQYYNESFIT